MSSLSSIVTGFSNGSSFINPVTSVASTLNSAISGSGAAITFNGYIAGTTLTVTTTPSGNLVAGKGLTGTGVTSGTTITSQSGGTASGQGTYVVSTSQTVGTSGATVAMTATPSSTVQTLLNNLSALTSSIAASMSSMLSNLPSLLPQMAAADDLEKKMTISTGSMPASGAGTNFTSAFSPLTDLPNQINSLSSAMTTHAAGLASEDSTAISAMQSAHDSVSSAVTSSLSASSAAQTAATSSLTSLSFAHFLTSAQPAHVTSIISQTVSTLPDVTTLHMDVQAGSSTLKATYIPSPSTPTTPVVTTSTQDSPPTATAAPAATTTPTATAVCGGTYDTFKAQYIAQQANVLTQWNTAHNTWKALVPSMEAWKAANYPNPTYDQIKAASTTSPAAMATYLAAKNNMMTNWPSFNTWLTNVQLDISLTAAWHAGIKQWADWNSADGGVVANAICDHTQWANYIG